MSQTRRLEDLPYNLKNLVAGFIDADALPWQVLFALALKRLGAGEFRVTEEDLAALPKHATFTNAITIHPPSVVVEFSGEDPLAQGSFREALAHILNGMSKGPQTNGVD